MRPPRLCARPEGLRDDHGRHQGQPNSPFGNRPQPLAQAAPLIASRVHAGKVPFCCGNPLWIRSPP